MVMRFLVLETNDVNSLQESWFRLLTNIRKHIDSGQNMHLKCLGRLRSAL